MPDTLYDEEFGTVRIRRVARAKYIRLRIRHDGSLSLTLPKRAALSRAHALIDESRASIRETVRKSPSPRRWSDGDAVGAVYRLVVRQDEMVAACTTAIKDDQAIVLHHPQMDADEVQMAIHAFVKKLLRKQAAAYIPRRLSTLADTHRFSYDTLRYSNAETRWGSCSSSGTISLNIWLMTLPLELVEYVLVHELAHTRHLNHSPAFWQTVADCLPDYATLRKELKQHSPRP